MVAPGDKPRGVLRWRTLLMSVLQCCVSTRQWVSSNPAAERVAALSCSRAGMAGVAGALNAVAPCRRQVRASSCAPCTLTEAYDERPPQARCEHASSRGTPLPMDKSTYADLQSAKAWWHVSIETSQQHESPLLTLARLCAALNR